jgi:hypothetical protein
METHQPDVRVPQRPPRPTARGDFQRSGGTKRNMARARSALPARAFACMLTEPVRRINRPAHYSDRSAEPFAARTYANQAFRSRLLPDTVILSSSACPFQGRIVTAGAVERNGPFCSEFRASVRTSICHFNGVAASDNCPGGSCGGVSTYRRDCWCKRYASGSRFRPPA